MNTEKSLDIIDNIFMQDPRYKPAAYAFLQQALDFTIKMLNKPAGTGPQRHVTGQELLEGIRCFTLKEYGPMSMTVLTSWGIRSTEDFGEMVFNLVENKLLGKTEEDKKEHFANGYNFHDAFVKPFLPATAPSGNKKKKTSKNE